MHPVLMDHVHRSRVPGVPGTSRGRTRRERSVLAVAVRASDPAGTYAAAVLLPRDVAPRRARQRDSSVRSQFRRSRWPPIGRDSRVHGQTCAARGVAARLGGDATRLLYTLGWHEVPSPAASEDAAIANGTWLISGSDELAATVPGCISFDRTTDPELLGQLLAQAHQRGMDSPASSGAVPAGAQRKKAPARKAGPSGSRPSSPTC